MALAALDDRTFESAVENTPEQAAEILRHFQDKGYDVEVEGEEPPAGDEKPVETTPPAEDKAPDAKTAVEEPPAEGVDAETQADWQTAKNDGEKLGRYAKQTLRRKAVEAELLKEKAVNDELRRQLEARNGSSSAPPAAVTLNPLTPAVVTQPKQEAESEQPKPKEFDKPKPGKPKYEDFLTADDPIAAHADAVADWNEKSLDWREEKRDFDARQRTEVENHSKQQEQVQQADREKQRKSDERFQVARQAHPDFDEKTKTATFNPVLIHLLADPDYGLEDGMELGYQLAQPENKEFLAGLVKNTHTVKGEEQRSVERKLMKATEELAVFRHSLKNKPPEPPKPAATVPVTETVKPKQTPPVEPLRREEAAPTPVRGRGAPAERLEDIPLEDSDGRRAWKKAHGVM